eukprot:m.272240 g.272240  ORF g.272240 m.272240 type:complete len:390 (-) comp100471_c0_seq1:80-1249(-)
MSHTQSDAKTNAEPSGGKRSLVEYCAFLEHKVLRLTNELSKFQNWTEQHDDVHMDPPKPNSSSEIPPWLVDQGTLEPLLIAYDQRIEDGDEKIATLQHELAELHISSQQLIVENRELSETLTEVKESIDPEDLHDMREHIALLLEENKLLLKEKQTAFVLADRGHLEVDRATAQHGKLQQRLLQSKNENGKLVVELLATRKSASESEREKISAIDELNSVRQELSLVVAELNQANQKLLEPSAFVSASTNKKHTRKNPVPSRSKVKPPTSAEDFEHFGKEVVKMEDELEVATNIIAELMTAVQDSSKRERKMRKALRLLAESTTESEQSAAQNAAHSKHLAHQSKRKDRALKHLLIQLVDTQHEVDSTTIKASEIVQEATRILRGRTQK